MYYVRTYIRPNMESDYITRKENYSLPALHETSINISLSAGKNRLFFFSGHMSMGIWL